MKRVLNFNDMFKKDQVKHTKKDFDRQRKLKIENGARDFAVRFEKVMRDLAKG